MLGITHGQLGTFRPHKKNVDGRKRAPQHLWLTIWWLGGRELLRYGYPYSLWELRRVSLPHDTDSISHIFYYHFPPIQVIKAILQPCWFIFSQYLSHFMMFMIWTLPLVMGLDTAIYIYACSPLSNLASFPGLISPGSFATRQMVFDVMCELSKVNHQW